MTTTKYDVLISLAFIIRKYKGFWCYASRQKLLDLLNQYHDVSIGYRQLGNHLKDLRDAGLIKSWKRNHRNDNGTLCLLTSARCLTIKGCKYLISRGVAWARNHMQRLKSKYIPPKPEEQHTPPPKEMWRQQPRKPTKNPFLDPTARKRMGLKPEPPFKVQPNEKP